MRALAISGVVLLPSLFAAVAMADAPLRLNEIRTEQPGADFDEYIEIAGASAESLAGVSIVVVGDDDFALPGQQNGVIESVVSLDGLSVASSGFLVVAEKTFSLGTANLVTSLNLEGGDNVTFFLVRGFTGNVGDKLDTNDDGTLDVTPWTSVVSSVALVANAAPNGVDSDFFYSTTTVGPDAGDQPAAAYRCANTTQWIAGSIDPLAGIDSPGAANPTCVPQGIVINEIRVDQTGADNDEYFELKGGVGQSLNDLTYLVIGDGGATSPSGSIEALVSLAGKSIAADGLFLVAETTLTLGTADYVVGAAGLNFENGDNCTHLLVRGFTGAINTDLDTNDDGVLDITPWAEIVDSVAFVDRVNAMPPATGERWIYSAVTVGPDNAFIPGHAYRCNPTGAWSIGAFDPLVGADSPGLVNDQCNPCGPGAGNCHAVHAAPGCIDATCCTAVCVVDPTCCDTTWDQDCVDQARTSCLASGAAPVLSFNEIRIDEPGTSDSNEYIEIAGAPGTSLNGVSIVIIGDGSDVSGGIEAVVSLNGVVMPKDGILLVAESTFALGTPDVTRSLNLENGNSVTYLLVFNFLGLNYQELDATNDCVLDAQPWDALVDSLGILAGDGNCVYSANTAGPDYFGQPAHLVKCTDGSWRFGRFDPAAVDGFGTPGSANTLCPPPYACGNAKAPSCYTVHGAPGCSDGECCESVCRVDITCCEATWDASCVETALLFCFVPATAPAVTITEVRIDQLGTDNDEYFELYGEPGTLLNGLTYIVIGDGAATAGSGVIEYAVGLQGNRIPADGFFLAARSTITLGGATPDFVLPTNPEFENSDNVTHVLVFNFTGAVGDDLDTDDNGTLDLTPWTTLVQSIAFIESAAVPPVNTEYAYGDARVGPDPSNFVPSQIAYCPGDGTYAIGVFDTAAATDTPGVGVKGCTYETGPDCPADLDGDGVVGASDLSALLGNWGGSGAGDIDGDGTIGASDLSALLGSWGPCS